MEMLTKLKNWRWRRQLQSSSVKAILADADVNPIRPHQHDFANADTQAADKPQLDPIPTVSVVLGSFNRMGLIQPAIDSIRGDLAQIPHEIIVVDGGSDDGSLEWLVRQGDIITLVQHNRYTHEGQARRKMSWGRFMNMGFRAAVGKYVMMVSDDCYLLPGSTSAAIQRIEEVQDQGLRVGACAFYFRDWPVDDRYFVQRTFGGNLMLNHGLYTREALQEVGFCEEEEFVFYKADSDLSLRIWQAGFAIIDSEASICEHYVGNNAGNNEIRAGNNATLDWDRNLLRSRWDYMLGDQAVEKMGRVYLEAEPSNAINQIWGNPVESSS
ncbi:MAG: glycosyltransferase [Pseudomonadota bacterium]